MQDMDPAEKSKIDWNLVFLFLLLAIVLIAIGLFFYPAFLYVAGAMIFITNLFFMARRRMRAKKDREKEWVNTDDIF